MPSKHAKPSSSRWPSRAPNTVAGRGVIAGLALGGLLFSACAGPCAKVKTARADFDAKAGPARGYDLAMWLPYARLDKLIAPQIAGLDKVPIELPELIGLSLPRLQGMVEAVRVRPAPAGMVGFAIRVSLRSAGKRLLVVELTANVAPRLDRAADVISIDLANAQVGDLQARVDKAGTRELSNWLWSQLPQAVRSMTPRGVVDEAVAGLSSELVSELGAQFKDELPALFEDVAAIEIQLGGLPLDAVGLRSDPSALQLALRSDLPVARGLSSPFAKPAVANAEVLELRMSGESLAAFANYAMREQLFDALPERYDDQGQPDSGGAFVARVSWARGVRPLKLDVFSEDKDCAHVTLGATPQVRVEGDDLVVQTGDAKLEKVHAGGIRVRSALFFGGVGRRSFELAQSLATQADFEVGGKAMRARVQRATLSVEGLTLALSLSPSR